jgi:hypothetical protein
MEREIIIFSAREYAQELRKARYTKRTGSPGNYKYEYGPKGGQKRIAKKIEPEKIYAKKDSDNTVSSGDGDKFMTSLPKGIQRVVSLALKNAGGQPTDRNTMLRLADIIRNKGDKSHMVFLGTGEDRHSMYFKTPIGGFKVAIKGGGAHISKVDLSKVKHKVRS